MASSPLRNCETLVSSDGRLMIRDRTNARAWVESADPVEAER